MKDVKKSSWLKSQKYSNRIDKRIFFLYSAEFGCRCHQDIFLLNYSAWLCVVLAVAPCFVGAIIAAVPYTPSHTSSISERLEAMGGKLDPRSQSNSTNSSMPAFSSTASYSPAEQLEKEKSVSLIAWSQLYQSLVNYRNVLLSNKLYENSELEH